MPKLIIDNREIEVPKGTKVIDAAQMLGITIPRFCYHPALGAVGACRVCAVKVLEGPVKGIQMSCMLDAQDGMVVSSMDEEVVDFRKQVIELLMLNHPHDCPVCDEGGQCLLQDMTISGGHAIRRYTGKKRTHKDQYLGPLVQHEMNRCIQCYRCSRYYREYSGYNDLGVMGIGSRVYFGRQKSGTLESPFSGNLIDLCPTGVYTDKPSRFKGRRWDFERTPSICANCSLGCNIIVSTRNREVVRQEARFNKNINNYFICDRGRYGFYYANDEKRPRNSKLYGKKTTTKNAIEAAAQKLDEIIKENGPSSVACIGSSRNSLETQAVLKYISGEKGWKEPVYQTDIEIDKKVKTAVSRLSAETSVSLEELEQSDFILAIGIDPVNEAPMLALPMRQAQKNGAKIAVIDPRPVSLPFEFKHIPAKPDNIESCLGILIKETIDTDIAETLGKEFLDLYNSIICSTCNAYIKDDEISGIAKDLQKSQQPVIVCGTGIVPVSVPDISADLTVFLKALNRKSGLMYILPGANAYGAGLLSDDSFDFEQLVSEIENRKIRALIAVENDLFTSSTAQEKLDNLLDKLELFIALDYINTKTGDLSHIFLPTRNIYETSGIYINNKGHMQQANKSLNAGMPIEQISNGDHPPREFSHDIPGSDFINACEALTQISNVSLDDKWLSKVNNALSGIPGNNCLPVQGLPISFTNEDNNSFKHKWENAGIDDISGLELILADMTFGTEILSSFSPCLKELEQAPFIMMQTNDAAQLDLNQGDIVEIEFDGDIKLKIPLKIYDNMAEGTAILPKYKKLADQFMGNNRKMISKSKIRKVVNI